MVFPSTAYEELYELAIASAVEHEAKDFDALSPECFHRCTLPLQRWLRATDIFLFDLTSEDARMHFLRFVIEFNGQRLPREYYRTGPVDVATGRRSNDVAVSIPHFSEFCGFEWPFARAAAASRNGLLERAQEAEDVSLQATRESAWATLPRPQKSDRDMR
jgi:hypothetical protein